MTTKTTSSKPLVRWRIWLALLVLLLVIGFAIKARLNLSLIHI